MAICKTPMPCLPASLPTPSLWLRVNNTMSTVQPPDPDSLLAVQTSQPHANGNWKDNKTAPTHADAKQYDGNGLAPMCFVPQLPHGPQGAGG